MADDRPAMPAPDREPVSEPDSTDDTTADGSEPTGPHSDTVPSEAAEGSEKGDAAAADASSATADTWWERRRARRAARKNRKAPWWEFPLLIVVALLVAILVKTFVAQPFYIPSGSMEKTLCGGPDCSTNDKILVNKLVYDVRDPHPGDIVVFKAPPGWNEGGAPKIPSNPIAKGVRKLAQLIGVVAPDDYVLVKRVIATGGQTVKGDAQGNVYISDHGNAGPWRKLNEPYVYRPGGVEATAQFGPVTVPKGRLWVMGDHRNDSADSRYHCGNGVGGAPAQACDPVQSTVPVKDVIGKAVWIIWPVSRWRTLGTPSTFNAAAPPVAAVAFVGPLALLLRRRRRR